VEHVQGVDYKGLKSFTCTIKINVALIGQDLRWRTLIHEGLHSVSVGLSQTDYQQFRGWEEGVVEQLQRLLRPQILAELNVAIREEIFSQDEGKNRFNIYMDALESLRQSVEEGHDPQTFYLWLLTVPLRERPTAVLKRGYALPFQERIAFVRTFSATNFILTQEAR
jgi:hypothetical protein